MTPTSGEEMVPAIVISTHVYPHMLTSIICTIPYLLVGIQEREGEGASACHNNVAAGGRFLSLQNL